MTTTDIYRRYAADCLRMARESQNIDDKAALIQMATMWQGLAMIVENAPKIDGENGGTDERHPDS